MAVTSVITLTPRSRQNTGRALPSLREGLPVRTDRRRSPSARPSHSWSDWAATLWRWRDRLWPTGQRIFWQIPEFRQSTVLSRSASVSFLDLAAKTRRIFWSNLTGPTACNNVWGYYLNLYSYNNKTCCLNEVRFLSNLFTSRWV